jgi:hypothetical protein
VISIFQSAVKKFIFTFFLIITGCDPSPNFNKDECKSKETEARIRHNIILDARKLREDIDVKLIDSVDVSESKDSFKTCEAIIEYKLSNKILRHYKNLDSELYINNGIRLIDLTRPFYIQSLTSGGDGLDYDPVRVRFQIKSDIKKGGRYIEMPTNADGKKIELSWYILLFRESFFRDALFIMPVWMEINSKSTLDDIEYIVAKYQNLGLTKIINSRPLNIEIINEDSRIFFNQHPSGLHVTFESPRAFLYLENIEHLEKKRVAKPLFINIQIIK